MKDNDFRNVGELIKEVVKECEKSSENESLVTGLKTGFYDLDYITRGLHNGDLVLLAGRRWMGKTVLAMSIAYNTLVKEKIPVAVFSPDLTAKQIMMRMLAMDADIYYRSIQNGLRKREEKDKLDKSAGRLADTTLYIDDRAYMTVKDIRERCIRLKAHNKPGLIIIDYLQMLSSEGCGAESETAKEMAVQLKELATEMECPVLVLSELSSEGERKWNVRPELSDMDDTYYTKQYADVIMMLHMDMQNRGTDAVEREAEVLVLKNRSGLIGKVKLRPDLGCSRFLNMR